MNITILGAGAWGTALAILLAERHPVMLWGREAQAMRDADSLRENRAYLPGFTLPRALRPTADFDAAVAHAGEDGLLIVATSVSGLRPVVERLRGSPVPNLVWLCKGLEENTRLLPHQVVSEVFGRALPHGALSGPSFAQEVAAGLPCALTVASASPELRERVVKAVHGRSMRVYASEDLVGVEVGGAVKNILAIATGVLDGMGLGLNARAALITRGLAEITRLGVALGGRAETFMGLTGVGDLILTCTGDLSRNRRVGLGLAEGKKLEAIVQELGHVAEGVRCAGAVRALAGDIGIEMPIADAVARVLFDGDSPAAMVEKLLSRDPRNET
ncbi:NAD(P)H-dependent glycerol-3-phosphate dehydrogenase [Noviherbaspirillum aridicola]|uniref:Glycerol-3-phosphate dehydrogenase [NAD(P)+] n=1 Tax=Noviherbaspirillum aridicola TaxID=2849687 RepID=A0ABQ4Q142_9BURK|nr:NAD(P)H-dependent glycerol-3-phosphate dehydrogenase [Noviherbaspirillum aridicola]GIZ50771.1 glycerol-3-phosphate dehydrogenase [NAD(P)+] [Noviherbaspirillum aridicola]